MIQRIVLAIVAMVFTFEVEAWGQSQQSLCKKNTSEVKTVGGNLRLRDYLCSTPDGERLRIQLHRVNDALAHAMISNELPSELNKILGHEKFSSNKVSDNFVDLMKQFGELREFPCHQFIQFAPGSSQVTTGEKECETRHKRMTLGGWRDDWDENLSPFPAADDLKSLVERNEIPSSFTKVDSKNAWRYLTSKDFDNLEENIKRTNKMVLGGETGPDGSNVAYPHELKLFRHIAGGRLPKRFSYVEAQFWEGGCSADDGWSLSYTPRPMIVEVALIKNVSRKSIRLSNFVGVVSRTSKLRKNLSSSKLASSLSHNLDNGDINLKPGERSLMFQRMTFGAPQSTYPVDSFDYGPAAFLRGFTANDSKIVMDGTSHNATLLSMSTEGGSCPYLYVRKGDEWINYGKVLHEAKGIDLKQWDARTFEGFKGTFRLKELEPERAIIDQAVLDVVLKSGKELTLRPVQPSLHHSDEKAERINMYESIDVRFVLPGNVNETQVATSHLRLLGHYDRYSTLLQTSSLSKDVAPAQFCQRSRHFGFASHMIKQMVQEL